MAQENPVAYVYKDPTGDTPDAASPIHVGVKWNDSDSQETKLEKIITQKYLATYPNGFEAWVDLRRTGFPRMLPVLNIDEADGSLVPGDIIVVCHSLVQATSQQSRMLTTLVSQHWAVQTRWQLVSSGIRPLQTSN